MSRDTALLIIDAQVNMFEEGNLVFDGKKLLHTLSDLIAKARAANSTIVYVQNNGREGDPDMPGTPGWHIHPAIPPEKGDILVQKRTPDSFYETDLQSELDARHVRQLVVAGMQTEMCIDATCRKAHQLGYLVILVSDAHSTFDDGGLTAPEIIARHNDALQTIIKVEEASCVSFEEDCQ